MVEGSRPGLQVRPEIQGRAAESDFASNWEVALAAVEQAVAKATVTALKRMLWLWKNRPQLLRRLPQERLEIWYRDTCSMCLGILCCRIHALDRKTSGSKFSKNLMLSHIIASKVTDETRTRSSGRADGIGCVVAGSDRAEGAATVAGSSKSPKSSSPPSANSSKSSPKSSSSAISSCFSADSAASLCPPSHIDLNHACWSLGSSLTVLQVYLSIEPPSDIT